MPHRPAAALERLLTIPDAAEFLRVSPKTVRRLISVGELTAAKIGNQWRIDPKDAKRFFVERLSR